MNRAKVPPSGTGPIFEIWLGTGGSVDPPPLPLSTNSPLMMWIENGLEDPN